MDESRWGLTRRFAQFFDCYAVRLAAEDSIESSAVARRLLRQMTRNDRPVAVILDAQRQWERSCAVARELIELTSRQMMRTSAGTQWIGCVLEVDSLAPALVDALAGELGDDAYRAAIAIAPGDPTPASLKLALRVAKTPLQLIASLYDDADPSELALFQRQVERTRPLTGRGVVLVPRI